MNFKSSARTQIHLASTNIFVSLNNIILTSKRCFATLLHQMYQICQIAVGRKPKSVIFLTNKGCFLSDQAWGLPNSVSEFVESSGIHWYRALASEAHISYPLNCQLCNFNELRMLWYIWTRSILGELAYLKYGICNITNWGCQKGYFGQYMLF